MRGAFGAWADTETVGGYTWIYHINGETAEICNDRNTAISPASTGAVTIPSTLGGKPVTSIGYNAFSGCSGLTSVTIPNSVTRIGEGAFEGCSGLASIKVPDSVCTRVGPSAFAGSAAYIFAQWRPYRNTEGVLGVASQSTSSGGASSSGSPSGGASGGGSGYALSDSVGDSTITSMTVSGDTAIDSFLLADGQVFDMAIRIVNTAATPIRLSLPAGYEYETVGEADPLEIPAASTNMVTITRTAAKTFLVSRQQLRKVL